MDIENKNITLGILIPCYNAEKYLSKLINHLLDLKCSNDIVYKLYLLNDGSTDNTQEIINKYSQLFPAKIVVISNKNNLGIFMGRLELLNLVDTDFAIFIDVDDDIDDSIFDKLLQFKDFDLIKLQRKLVFTKTEKLLEASVYQKTKTKNQLLTLTEYYYITGCFLKRSVYKNIVEILSNYKKYLLNINCYEDIILYYLAVNFANSFSIINAYYYYNRTSNGATKMSSTIQFNYLTKIYTIFKMIEVKLKSTNSMHESDTTTLFYILFLMRNFATTKSQIKDTQLLIKDNFPKISLMTGFKNKIKYLICINDNLFNLFKLISR